MAIAAYIQHKAETLKKLFYYRVVVNLIRLKERWYKLCAPATRRYELAIIDDYIPNPVAGFRGSEFAYLLREIDNSVLFSIVGSVIDKKKDYRYHNIKTKEQYVAGKRKFVSAERLKDSQLQPFFSWTKINCRLAYTVFLTNGTYLIDYFEQRKIRFILELYPGGSFCTVTDGPEFDHLKRVLGSEMLEKVIVTQKNSLEFVTANQLCDPAKIEFIYGVILSEDFLDIPPKELKYAASKQTLDICFAAAKYMPRGLDKGYDIFVDMAHILLRKGYSFRFHVVGGFNEDDVPIDPEFRNQFHFYGFLKGREFTDFYKDKDIFVSPSRANTLARGAFDGFPTAACAEAGLHGLCLLLSDPLGLNMVFTHGTDTIIPENIPGQFADFIINLANNPEEMYRIGETGKKTIQTHFGHQAQLVSRLSAITQSLQKLNRQ